MEAAALSSALRRLQLNHACSTVTQGPELQRVALLLRASLYQRKTCHLRGALTPAVQLRSALRSTGASCFVGGAPCSDTYRERLTLQHAPNLLFSGVPWRLRADHDVASLRGARARPRTLSWRARVLAISRCSSLGHTLLEALAVRQDAASSGDAGRRGR